MPAMTIREPIAAVQWTRLTDHEIRRSFDLPDERLAALPLVSEHAGPQDAPQEYECGCVTVTRITDRDSSRGERPFEMRLARACGSASCELPISIRGPGIAGEVSTFPPSDSHEDAR